MSFRVAARRVPTLALARPTVAPRAAATSVAAIRLYSDKPSPEARASSIIDSLPGNSLVSKTGWVTLGTGLTAVAISKEIYVANEETVILVGSLIFAVLVGRAITGPYKEWADSQIEVRIPHFFSAVMQQQQQWRLGQSRTYKDSRLRRIPTSDGHGQHPGQIAQRAPCLQSLLLQAIQPKPQK